MTEKEMIEIKHGSENMVDLLNQEQAELKKGMIEELGNTLYCKQDKFDLSNPFEVAKAVVEEGYRKILEGAVVITRGEYERLKSLESRVAELENGIAKSMLGCEFMPECTDKILTSFILELKEKLPASMKKACAKIIFRLASEYGVDIKEYINNENNTKKD